MRSKLVCPACGQEANLGIDMRGEPKAFERYHCSGCGADMLTEDLVVKRAYAHAHGHTPWSGGGNVVFDPTAFPHIWMYFGTSGSGSGGHGDAFMTSPGVFDAAAVAALAKWDFVTLNISPFTNTDHPENLRIVSLLRAANPRIKILWYHLLTNVFDFSSAVSMWGETATLASTSLLLRTDNACRYPDGIPSSNTAGFWDVTGKEAAFLALWQKYGVGNSDGYFHDYLIGKPANWNSAIIDLASAGYGSVAAMNAATGPATDTIIAGLQATGELQYGNRGGASFYTQDSTIQRCNGELFESWDANNVTDFDSWMTTASQWQGSSPTGDGTALFKAEIGGPNGGSAFDSTYLRRVRFTLGSACILGGRAYIGFNRSLYGDDLTLWADEYTVTPAGATDTSKSDANKGWLGRPVEFGAKDSGSSLYIRRFDRGIVLVNGTGVSHSYNLGKPYRRIQGVYDTSVNDGATISSVTVPARDARFLLS